MDKQKKRAMSIQQGLLALDYCLIPHITSGSAKINILIVIRGIIGNIIKRVQDTLATPQETIDTLVTTSSEFLGVLNQEIIHEKKGNKGKNRNSSRENTSIKKI